MLKFANRSRTALSWAVVALLVGFCSWVFLKAGGYTVTIRSPINEEVRARGRLKLIGRVSGLRSEQFQRVVADLLKREKVTRSSSLYRHLPNRLTVQVPPIGPMTPIIPRPPALRPFNVEDLERSLEQVHADVTGGSLAAAVTGRSDPSFSPCRLTIKYGPRGSAQTIQVTLVERISLRRAQLVMYGGDGGLLVLVHGKLPDSSVPAEYGEHFAAVYSLEAPQWEPVVLMDTEQLGKRPWVAGTTVDGGSVFITVGRRSLWRVDTEAHSIQQIIRGARYVPGVLIPSPDDVFLAGGADLTTFGSKETAGMWLVDCRDGSVHNLTWRDHGSYSDSPLAWSADVPGCLYFHAFGGNIWQLDIDLSQEGPDCVRRWS